MSRRDIGILVFVVLALIFGTVLVSRRGSGQLEVGADENIVLSMENGQMATFRPDGVVEMRSREQVFYQVWEASDGSSLYDYFKNKIESGEYMGLSGEILVSFGGSSFYIPGDSVTDEVFDELSDGSGEGEGGDGGDNIGDVFDFVDTPTPTPPGGGGSGAGGGGGGDDDCPFWRLSYCVYPYMTPTPTVTTSTPTYVILPPDCESNSATGRTVISKELCVPTPTSTP